LEAVLLPLEADAANSFSTIMNVPQMPAPNDMAWLEKKPEPNERMTVHAAMSFAMAFTR